MAGVIEGFLVSLGFDVDKDAQARFNHTVEDAGKRMRAFAKRATVATAAVAAAWVKTSKEIGKDYNFRNITGVATKGFMSLKQAISAVGGDGEAVAGILQDMSLKLKTMPGYARQIKHLFGVDVVDAAGNARDLSEVVGDIAERMQGMDQATSYARAQAIGLGGVWDSLMKKDFPSELRRAHAQMDGLGDAVDRTSESSKELSNSMAELRNASVLGIKAVVAELNEEFGIADKIRELTAAIPGLAKKLTGEAGAAISTEMRLWKESSGALDYVLNWLNPAVTDRIYAEERAKRGLDGGARPAGKADEKPAGEAPAPSSLMKTRAMRNNNPGNLRDAKTGKFRVFETLEAGAGAQARQLVMYFNAGARNLRDILHTYAPKSENDTDSYVRNLEKFLTKELGRAITGATSLNLKDPRVLHALQLGMIRVEAGAGAENYFRGSSFQREAEIAAKTTAVSRAWKPYAGRPAQETTVNMTFNVRDAELARKAAREVQRAVRSPSAVRDGARGAA